MSGIPILKVSRRTLTTAIVSFGLVPLLLILWGVGAFVYELVSLEDRLTNRHGEATQLIRTVYSFAQLHRKWPTWMELSTSGCNLSKDWEYVDQSSKQSGPIIFCRGPHHSSIRYEFPGDPHSPPHRNWIFGIEGTHKCFVGEPITLTSEISNSGTVAAAVETPSPAVLGEAGTSPAEKKSP